MAIKALVNVQHNGKLYRKDDELPNMKADELKRLIDGKYAEDDKKSGKKTNELKGPEGAGGGES